MTCPFHFVVYYNDNEYEPRKNTRNDDVSTQKFRSRTRCRSEILTSLILVEETTVFPYGHFELKHVTMVTD